MADRPFKICLKMFCISLILSFCLVLSIPAFAQSNAPSNGDWTIKDSEIVSHKSITLNGNIIIKSGGELQLNNADLKFNSNKDFEYKIHIEDGGELEMRYSSINLNSDYSIVIIVESEGNLRIYNSTIYEFSTIEQETVDEDIGDLSFMLAIMIIIIVIIVVLITLIVAMKKNVAMLEQLKGKTGEVENPVHPDKASGTVKVDTLTRSAKTKSDKMIESGKKVNVVDVEGLFLIVEPVEDEAESVNTEKDEEASKDDETVEVDEKEIDENIKEKKKKEKEKEVKDKD